MSPNEFIETYLTFENVTMVANWVVMGTVTALLVYSRVSYIKQKVETKLAQKREQKAVEDKQKAEAELQSQQDVLAAVVNSVENLGDMIGQVVSVSKINPKDKQSLLQAWGEHKGDIKDFLSKSHERFMQYYEAMHNFKDDALDYVKDTKESVLSQYVGKDETGTEDTSKQ